MWGFETRTEQNDSIMWRRSMDDDNIYDQLELRKGGNPAFCKLMRKRKPQKES